MAARMVEGAYLGMSIKDEVSNPAHVLFQSLAEEISGTHKNSLRPVIPAELNHLLHILSLHKNTSG